MRLTLNLPRLLRVMPEPAIKICHIDRGTMSGPFFGPVRYRMRGLDRLDYYPAMKSLQAAVRVPESEIYRIQESVIGFQGSESSGEAIMSLRRRKSDRRRDRPASLSTTFRYKYHRGFINLSTFPTLDFDPRLLPVLDIMPSVSTVKAYNLSLIHI